MKHKKRPLALFFALLAVAVFLSGCDAGTLAGDTPASSAVTGAAPQTAAASAKTKTAATTAKNTAAPAESGAPDEDGVYTGKKDVALYIHVYGRLPGNYITKADARALGWTGGPLGEYAPGRNIGGDRFGNYEGLLPAKPGRIYYECDIGTTDTSSRGARRIVFSNDGLVYYTDDHYGSFTQLYGGKNP